MAKVSLRSYNREIETMIDRGQLDEAVAHCHHILKTFPKHLETYRLLGKAYLENKRYGEATDIFSRILVSVPNDFVAQVGMSIIRDEENKLNDAIWHMERAFETQPSNSAIQGELQRLYGRRDGVQPPRIRMTRGALAHMYVQGELYPQAISEIKSVLKEDPERSDMQALLARACYKSGAKNDAVDAALILLQRYPYSFDANRVLVEVLNADRNENAQVYRQRVVELDPYAAQVPGSIFQSNEVPDAAVSIERLDWNGQPVGMQADWRESKAVALESGLPSNEEPDWMKSSFADTNPPALPQSTSSSMFEESTAPGMAPAQPAEDIPDFLKAAGWGESTGTFDESKSIFADEEPAATASQSIEQGDLPDWVKAMAPQTSVQNEEKEEELPDWINKIGPAGALSSEVSVPPDWTSQLDEPSTSTASEANDPLGWLNDVSQPEPAAAQSSVDQPDWLAGLESGSDFTPQAAQTDVPDWMKETSDESPAAQGDLPAWMSGLGSEAPAMPSSPSDMPDWAKQPADEISSLPSGQSDVPDWMSELSETSSAPSGHVDTPDWMSGLGNETPATPASQSEMPDWAKELSGESPSLPAAQSDLPDWTSALESETPATLSASQSDVPDWVRGLGEEIPATPSGAADEPDWMKGLGDTAESTPSVQADESEWMNQVGAPSESTPAVPATNDFDFLNELTQEPTPETSSIDVPVATNFDTLGVSDQDRDDSFAWLENLAAKQGASEGLLNKPEDRLQEETEWVKQAKGISSEPPVSQTPEAAPSVNAEELGKSEQERDDSFAWLENLAAKQGASEGLLTRPEDRLQEEPEWVKQAKDSASQQPPVSETPVTPSAATVEELGKSEQERDDSFAWLENLAAKQGATEGLLTKPEDRLQEEPEWVKQAKDSAAQQSPATEQPVVSPAANLEELGKSEQERDDSFSWLESLAAKQGASEGLLTKPEDRLQEEPEWVKQAKDSGTQQPPISQAPPSIEELGKSDQERDDSFSWLENLAAKQGASEGLLTKPEDRLQEEPEWVRQAKESVSQQPPEVSEPPVTPPSATVEDLGKSEQERDDSFAWLENLAAKQGASEGLLTKPEDRLQEEPDWVKQAKDLNAQQQPAPVSEQPDDTEAWLKDLAEKESAPEMPAQMLDVDMPAWMDNMERDETPVAEESAPAGKSDDQSDWIGALESPAPVEEEKSREDELPSWLSELDQEEKQILTASINQDDLPEWLRGEDVAPAQTPEPTRTTDWRPAEVKQPKPEPEPAYTPPAEEEKQSEPELIYSPPLMEEKPPEPELAKPLPPVSFDMPEDQPHAVQQQQEAAPESTTPPHVIEPVAHRGADPMLGMARNELSRSNIGGALESYGKLIKKARFLDEVIHDLRDALYRYPVDVNIWQSLGDAYMRANRLQDALDAYTKAEELLR